MLRQILLFCLMTFTLSANHVHWLGEYDKALQLALKEHKPLLVLVVKKKTKLCNTIVQQHLMNHPYIDTINAKMIAVMVTYEGKTSYPIEMYYTTTFPTLFFVDTKSETFMREPLYGEEINASSLSDILQNL